MTEQELTELYSESYYSSWAHDKNASADELPYWELKRKYFKRLLIGSGRSFTKNERALDIGCATGASLSVFSDLGLLPYGVDINPFAIEASKKNVPNARLYTGDFKMHPIELNDFSVVLMTDVLEHVEDPLELLKEVFESMSPDGCLILVTPDITSISRKVMRGKWPHYKPEHLFLFGERGIRKILSDAGFTVYATRPSVKMLSIQYVLGYFENYGGTLTQRICRWLHKVVPKRILEAVISVSIGERLVYASR